jgi:predicted HAD superfamily Cof-like phosphohydrolase
MELQGFNQDAEQTVEQRAAQLDALVRVMETKRLNRAEGDFSPFADIKEFHTKFDLAYDGPPRFLDMDLADFRHKFDMEEAIEWLKANTDGHKHVSAPAFADHHDDFMVRDELANCLDAAVDQMYVLIGKVYLQGLMPYFVEAWRRVHEANMAKVRSQSSADTTRDTKFDVVKPVGWTAPCHIDLVADHAYKTGAPLEPYRLTAEDKEFIAMIEDNYSQSKQEDETPAEYLSRLKRNYA